MIVLACGVDRRPMITPYVIALQRYGYKVDLLFGPDAEPPGMIAAAHRAGRDAVYVLCGGGQIGPEKVEAMRSTLLAQAVPSFHIWGGMIEAGNPNRVLNEVAHRLAALGFESSRMDALPRPPPPPAPPPTPTPPPISSVPPANLAPEASSAHAAASDLFDDDLPPRRLGRTPLLLAAGAGVLAIVVGLVTYGSSPDEDADEAEAETEVAAESADEEEAPVAKVDPPAEAPAQAGADDEAAGGDAPEAADEEVARPPAEPAVEAATDDPPEADIDLDGDEPRVPGSDEDLVFAALEGHQIRSLDILLLSPVALDPRKKRRRKRRVSKMSFADAQSYCEQLDIAGVVGWRLPTVGELTSLSRARRIDDYLFWSSTRADTYGEERLVWNARKERMGPAPTQWRGGRVICVRFQRPAEDDSAEPTLPPPEDE